MEIGDKKNRWEGRAKDDTFVTTVLPFFDTCFITLVQAEMQHWAGCQFGRLCQITWCNMEPKEPKILMFV